MFLDEGIMFKFSPNPGLNLTHLIIIIIFIEDINFTDK